MSWNTHDLHKQQPLPPNPPTTPPPAIKRRKKKADPFGDLASVPFPPPHDTPAAEAEDGKLLLTRLLLTPILFTSFILSLFLVNTRNRVLRVEARASSSSLFSSLFPASSEPYQDYANSTWGHRNSVGHFDPNEAIALSGGKGRNKKHKKSWHLHKKIRKVARLEVSDAFEMRGPIIVAMAVTMLIGCLGLWMGMRMMIGWWLV